METAFVVILFVGYLALWGVKRRTQRRTTGVDPEVLGRSTSPVQRFFNVVTKALTAYLIAMTVIHAADLHYHSLFARFPPLQRWWIDVTGFTLGIAGLGLCWYAQSVMGASWRVGIDEQHPTDLIGTGLYRLIRNPTYLGLNVLSLGVWLIWPTWTIALFGVTFYLMLEMQVRCEEEFLEKTHGERYREYRKKTKRYLPGLY